MNTTQWIALAVFTLTYALIVSEKLHRLKAAFFGLSGVLLLHLVAQKDAFSFIDFNTIGLLIGMMILVGVVKETGIIEAVSVKAIRLSGGRPWRLLVAMSLLTAIISALLDNVTTILLVGPIALAVAEALELDPEPFLFAEIFSSNIGGTATLIGDPPNILIGSAAGLSFNDFLFNLAPAAALALIVMYVVLYFLFGKELSAPRSPEQMNMPMGSGTFDKPLFFRVALILGAVLTAFTLHRVLHFEAATIALAGATAALLFCPVTMEKALEEVDWITILFFSALFMLVGTLEHLGIIEVAAGKMVSVVGEYPKLLVTLLIWGSGIISAIVDNVPYAAAMIPLVRNVAEMAHLDPEPLWWSLALGACLGGNGTLVGASANLVMVGIAEKGGLRMSFLRFAKIGMAVMLATLLTSTAYVFLRYF